MAARKIHVVWANGITYCGRPAKDGDVHAPQDATGDVCASCRKSYQGAHVVSNPYITAGNPR